MTTGIRTLVVATLLAFASTLVHADETGVFVTAVDAATGRPIIGASVTIKDRAGNTGNYRTDSSGQVTVGNLSPGFFTLRIAQRGYVSAVDPTVRIVDRRLAPVRIELRRTAIEEIVTVGKTRVANPGGPVSNSFFNRDELRNNPGTGSDVLRALDGMPGITSTGEFASFSVRGRGPRNNLIFVDDFPLDKVVHFDQSLGEDEDVAGGGRFSIFAPNSISGAEFSPGGWSSAYGGKSGSLLRLEVTGGGPTPVASLRVDLAGIEVGYEGPSGVDDNTTLFFTARQFDFGQVFDTIDELDIGDPELTDIILKTSTALNSNNDVETLFIVANEGFRRDIDNVLESPDFDDVSLVTAEQDLTLAGLTWRHRFGESSEWTNRVYVRSSEKLSTEGEAFPDLVPAGTPAPDVPVRQNIITIDEQETEFGWRSDYTQSNRFGMFAAGLRVTQSEADFATTLSGNWNRFVFESGDPRPIGQNFITWTPDVIDTRYDEQVTNGAVFAEQTFDFDGWSVRPGIRVDRDGFSSQNLVSPRLSATFYPGADWRIAATGGIFYESPRLLIRASDTDNASLESERITHFSIGAERRLGDRWSVLAEVYFQQLDDLIVEEGRANGRAANLGEGTNFGADIVVNRRFANGWSGNMTYSYNRQRLDDNDGFGKYTADLSREHFFTLSARWEISERWQLAWRWKYGTGIPDDRFIVFDDVLPAGQPRRFGREITATNVIRADDYHGLNIRMDYRRSLGLVDLVAFLDVLNVYGGPNGAPRAFNYLNGTSVIEEDEAFPLVGLFFERSW
ncbi:MAG: TonB-dependent receptor [Pseudomonadota bacterium]